MNGTEEKGKHGDVAISVTLPVDQTEIANKFFQALTFPGNSPDGCLRAPPPLNITTTPDGPQAYVVREVRAKSGFAGGAGGVAPAFVVFTVLATPVTRDNVDGG